MVRPFRTPAILLSILLLALALRLAPWGHNRFLEDEALYAYWGLQIATGADPMLNAEPVDKPPLHPYLLALSFRLLGQNETAARLPGLMASMAGVALMYALGRTLTPTGVNLRRRRLEIAPVGAEHRSAPGRPPARTEASTPVDAWPQAPEVRLESLPLTPVALSPVPPSSTGGCLKKVFSHRRERRGIMEKLGGLCVSAAQTRTFSAASTAEGRLHTGRGEEVALLAALLLALSPFDILFASTAFTDPPMTAWVLAALLAAAQGHLGRAGLLAGLAAATKQQGLFFLPLVVVVASGPPQSPSPRRAGWLRFFLGLALIAAGVIGWDAARLQRPGFFQQSLISYGGLGPVRPQALGERAVEWLRLVGLFWVSPWFNGLLAVALLLWIGGSGLHILPCPLSRTEGAMLIFVVGFLVLHWPVGFQVWDRYLLGLVPLLALLAARAFVALTGGRGLTLGLGLVLAILLAGPVVRATRSEIPVGGDHGAYDGIDALAAWVRTSVPPGAVLYHHWLGYHYRFYLYGAPLRLHWYPDPADLVHDARVYRREPRYIAFPSFRDSAPMEAALADAGIHLVPVFQTTRRDGTVSFRLYRLEGP